MEAETVEKRRKWKYFCDRKSDRDSKEKRIFFCLANGSLRDQKKKLENKPSQAVKDKRLWLEALNMIF